MGKNPSYKDLKRGGERHSGNKFVVFQELKEKEGCLWEESGEMRLERTAGLVPKGRCREVGSVIKWSHGWL